MRAVSISALGRLKGRVALRVLIFIIDNGPVGREALVKAWSLEASCGSSPVASRALGLSVPAAARHITFGASGVNALLSSAGLAEPAPAFSPRVEGTSGHLSKQKSHPALSLPPPHPAGVRPSEPFPCSQMPPHLTVCAWPRPSPDLARVSHGVPPWKALPWVGS